MTDIKTEYVCPPVPSNKFDWVAYRDGDEEWQRGYGETEQAAINDLLEQES